MNKENSSQSINNKKTIDLFNKAFYLMNSQTLSPNATTNYYLHYISDINYLNKFKFKANLPFDYQEAIKILSSILDFNPKDKYVLHLQGTCYYIVKQYQQAEKSFRDCINIDAAFAMPYNSLGNIYQISYKDNKKAIEYYGLGIKANPNLRSAYFNQTETYIRIKEFELAYSNLRKYNDLQPNCINALEYLSKISLNLELYRDTLKYTSGFINLNNSNADIYYVRGKAFFKLKQNKEAVKAYDKAADLDPKYKKKEQLLTGLSFEKPFQVMFVPDVYRIMKEKYPFYKMISQKLVYHKDSKYDIMSLTNREGENINLYFKYFIDQMPKPIEGSIKLPDKSELEDENKGEEMDDLSIKELIEIARKQADEYQVKKN